MPFALSFAIKLLPLYINILLGFVAGKKFKVGHEGISNLLFYIISPLIMFNGVINTRLDESIISLPFVTFMVSSFLCLFFYRQSKKIWSDPTKNLMAFSAGSGATGYFGLPVAMLIFDEQTQGMYIMALLGVALYDSWAIISAQKGLERQGSASRKFYAFPLYMRFFWDFWEII